MKKIGAVLLMAALTGCAFHEPTEVGGMSEPSTPASLSTARFAWWVPEVDQLGIPTGQMVKTPRLTRILESSQRGFRTTPVTLPAQVPDRLELELTLPGDIDTLAPQQVLIQYLSSAGQRGVLTAQQVAIGSHATTQSVVLLEMEGLRRLLPDQSEATLELRIILQRSDGEIWSSATVVLRTPPALLEIEQAKLGERDLEGFRSPTAIKKLTVEGNRFDLLQVGRVKNLSGKPVEIQLRPRVFAHLWLRRDHHRAEVVNECKTTVSSNYQMIPLSTDMRVFPLSDELPRLAGNEVSQAMKLEPEQTLLVGIYASGEKVVEVVEGRFVPLKPAIQRVATHCEAKCEQMRMAANEFPSCWRATFDRTGETRARRADVQNCVNCSSGIQSACEACKVWEETNRFFDSIGPNCLFCGQMVEYGRWGDHPLYRGIPQWRNQQVFAEVAVGQEDGPMRIEADTGSSLLEVRFADHQRSDDPERRFVRYLRPVASYEGASQ